MVLTIFTWGMAMGPLAIFFELGFRWLINPAPLTTFLFSLPARNHYYFASVVFAAPVIEEFLKYSVVKFKVLKNPEFDEPLDAMLYMIIAALGFAAVENLLLVFQRPMLGIGQAITLSAARFISATFLHALTSGVIGYWLARAIRQPDKKFKFLLKGFSMAIIFHAAYNYFIWLYENSAAGGWQALLPIFVSLLIVLTLAWMVTRYFVHLKKLHSVCKICYPNPQKN